jgi:hypothetical protein
MDANLEMLAELSDKISQSLALLSSLRFATAMVLTGQRKWNLQNLSRQEVSDLHDLADILDKQVAEILAQGKKKDKVGVSR